MSWWKRFHRVGVVMFSLGLATLVGNVFYMVGYTMLRKGAPVEVLVIFGALAIALAGAGIAAYTEKRAKGW